MIVISYAQDEKSLHYCIIVKLILINKLLVPFMSRVDILVDAELRCLLSFVSDCVCIDSLSLPLFQCLRGERKRDEE